MEIYGDIDELEHQVKGLKVAKPAMEKALVSALNKTITSLRAEAVRMVFKEYNVKQKEIRKELKISRASPYRHKAMLRGEGSPGIPLMDFSPTPKKVPSTKRLKGGGYTPKGGIKVMVRRGQRKMVKGAFIAKMPSGHVGVFRRAVDGRLGRRSRRPVIEERFGPSPLRIISADRYQIPLDDFAGETLDRNMAREADYFLKKFGVIPKNV